MITWKKYPEDPRYEVSQNGEVRKAVNATHPERRQYAPIAGIPDKDGYLYIRINGKKWLVHRLVYALFCGALDPELVVCHLDGDNGNNSFENLKQTTQQENISHKRLHGTHQIGEKHGSAKYSDETVRRVKAAVEANRAASGKLRKGTGAKIAASHGVGLQLIYDLSRSGNRTWGHV